MCSRLETQDATDKRIERDVGDGIGDLAPTLEVGTDSLEYGIHFGVLIVEAVPSMEEVLGNTLRAEEDLRTEIGDEH